MKKPATSDSTLLTQKSFTCYMTLLYYYDTRAFHVFFGLSHSRLFVIDNNIFKRNANSSNNDDILMILHGMDLPKNNNYVLIMISIF